MPGRVEIEQNDRTKLININGPPYGSRTRLFRLKIGENLNSSRMLGSFGVQNRPKCFQGVATALPNGFRHKAKERALPHEPAAQTMALRKPRVLARLAVLWTSKPVPQNGRRFGALCHGPVASLEVGGFDAQLAPLTERAPFF